MNIEYFRFLRFLQTMEEIILLPNNTKTQIIDTINKVKNIHSDLVNDPFANCKITDKETLLEHAEPMFLHVTKHLQDKLATLDN